MRTPQTPPNETKRMAALQKLKLLQAQPEERFDRITRMATRLFHVPIAAISIVEKKRLWFKSWLGLPSGELEHDLSFCAHGILQEGPFIIADASKHPWFTDNPLVTGELKILFYAGHPLRALDNNKVGMFCIMDHQPRTLSKDEVCLLQDLAAIAEHDLNWEESALLQRQLQENEERIRAIVNNVVDAIITIDIEGTILSFNRAAEKILGYTAEEAIGRNASLLMPIPYCNEHDHYIANYLQTKKHKVIGIGRETVARRKDGTIIPIDLSVTEMHVEQKIMFIGVLRDITERKKIDRMKNEFISTVSHELRTPLTSIRGSLGFLGSGLCGHLNEQGKNLADIAIRNTDRLIRLINDILDIEKIESGKLAFQLTPVELVPLIEQAVAANRAYGAQLGIEFVIHSQLPAVKVDVDNDRLVQVITNLLSNAAKFSPPHSQVEISTVLQHKMVRVQITDYGAGIPEDFKSRIFQKFAQADSSDTRQKGGTGLGLSIAKAIIERFGGQIGFTTQLNAGTMFYFDLPLWQEETTLPEEPEHRLRSPSPSRARDISQKD